MPLAVGEKLGPYEILAPIGAGGMGEVWKARDTRLDRIVAIKVSKTEFSERFEREARAVAALNHPHICQLYDVGPDYLVMEYVEGPDLRGPLDFEDALPILQQVIDFFLIGTADSSTGTFAGSAARFSPSPLGPFGDVKKNSLITPECSANHREERHGCPVGSGSGDELIVPVREVTIEVGLD